MHGLGYRPPPASVPNNKQSNRVHIPPVVVVIARINITMCVVCMDSAVVVTNRTY
jgi:hypothetical protein